MSLLEPSLRQKLGRLRLGVRGAEATSGIGERRSRWLGAGIEFADHRPYQLGDDIRYLDRYAYARLGQHHVKQFSLYQRLSVAILLDASASMAFGTPQKYRFGAALAAALAYIALAGGDSVLVGTFAGGTIAWFRRLYSVQGAAELCGWLERTKPRGPTELRPTVRRAAQRLTPGGLTILVSDWLDDHDDQVFTALEAVGQEVVAAQLLAPEEVEPERLGDGDVRLLDAESRLDVELSLDAGVFAGYRRELGRLRAQLAEAVRRHEGRYLQVRSDDDLERLLLRDWRATGFLS